MDKSHNKWTTCVPVKTEVIWRQKNIQWKTDYIIVCNYVPICIFDLQWDTKGDWKSIHILVHIRLYTDFEYTFTPDTCMAYSETEGTGPVVVAVSLAPLVLPVHVAAPRVHKRLLVVDTQGACRAYWENWEHATTSPQLANYL